MAHDKGIGPNEDVSTSFNVISRFPHITNNPAKTPLSAFSTTLHSFTKQDFFTLIDAKVFDFILGVAVYKSSLLDSCPFSIKFTYAPLSLRLCVYYVVFNLRADLQPRTKAY